ncbi:MAG: K(+)-transporting ATPase subunit C [Candidatus Saganbacteria bacterium]|nr:K(+)-transporting ATPase subunit C [Candidatus Saganbacteria bacterium]
MKNIIICVKFFILTAILTGLIYPFLITLIGQVAFNNQSNGSMFVYHGRVVGSTLIGQKFDQDKYFWPRPSAVDYNPLPSGGSNLSATSAKLKSDVATREAKLYASGSGLDPHISPAAAFFQVDRIVKARHFDSAQKGEIINLINQLTEGRDFRVLGEKRVNVLKLNASLDDLR